MCCWSLSWGPPAPRTVPPPNRRQALRLDAELPGRGDGEDGDGDVRDPVVLRKRLAGGRRGRRRRAAQESRNERRRACAGAGMGWSWAHEVVCVCVGGGVPLAPAGMSR